MLGTGALRLHAAWLAEVDLGQWVPAAAAAAAAAGLVGLICGLLLPGALRGRLGAAAALAALLVAAWDLRVPTSAVAFSPFVAPRLAAGAGAGDWQALAPPAATGLEYVSVLVLRRDGAPAGVELQGAAGPGQAAFGGQLVADGAPHRMNFRAPSGPFRVVTRGPVTVLSVTAFGPLARAAGKLIPLWGLLAAAAVLAAAAGTALAVRAGSAWTPAGLRALAAVALIGYVGLLCPHLDTYAGGADSSGYLNSADLLRHGHLTHALRRPADAAGLDTARFVPLGFTLRRGAPARLAPTYPPGLPALFALAMFVLPARAAVALVILAHFVAGIVLLAVFARQLQLGPGWSAALAAALALCPVYVFMGLQPMSDVPALVWVLAAAVAARAGRPFLCGAAFAVAVLIRPSNLLALPALLLLRAWTLRELATCALAALPFAAAEGWYNHALYGHALTTGYGDPSTLFSRSWLAPTFRHYLRWFPQLFTPFIGLAFAAPFLRRIPGRVRAALVLWALPFLVFYAAYFCTHETWWYLRFLLPSLPAWLAAATLAWPRRLPPRATALAALAAAAWLVAEDCRLLVVESGRGNRVYEESSLWLARHAPRDAIVLCNVTGGALLHDTPLTFAFVGSPAESREVAAYARSRHHPLYADFFAYEAPFLPADPAAGQWRPLRRFGAVVIWLWEPKSSRSAG
jgi:hypothetical protein